MRWRMIDRVTGFEAWRWLEARKTLSLEEYSLLESLGRKGVLPETLLLESCVQAAAWLIAASSQLKCFGWLTQIREFVCNRTPGPGEAIMVRAEVIERSRSGLWFRAQARVGDTVVAHAELSPVIQSIERYYRPAEPAMIWQEIYRPC